MIVLSSWDSLPVCSLIRGFQVSQVTLAQWGDISLIDRKSKDFEVINLTQGLRAMTRDKLDSPSSLSSRSVTDPSTSSGGRASRYGDVTKYYALKSALFALR
jgi:hypothetical protein